ncbi:hypothetical protein [Massilia sp. H6]|uniref:hypothetical protein n=1 Tax=Massilia sp. H6 TaxID=2970464 RepID=UPI002166F6BE|nr:hypothetical protein [Massilia sp. H6]UVW30677.1 hypothetical protein NRS07_20150 [Massilia sp. H6]
MHELDEIHAGEYRYLRNEFKQGSSAYRAKVATAMYSGEINRWEFRHLLNQHRNGVGPFSVSDKGLNLKQERLILAAMTRIIQAP